MSAPTVENLHQALLAQAQDWVDRPGGMMYDSGHCDSEICAGQIKRFLDRHGDASFQEQMIELRQMMGCDEVASGSWLERKAGSRMWWGRGDIIQALDRAGLGEAFREAGEQVKREYDNDFAKHAKEHSTTLLQALRHDVYAWLDDPGSKENHPGLKVAVRQEMDRRADDDGFLRMARALRSCLADFGLIGTGASMTGLRAVLSVFGNPDSAGFGMVGTEGGREWQKRYRPARLPAPGVADGQAPTRARLR